MRSGMMLAAGLAYAACAPVADAQTSVENGVIRSNGVTIDANGIHTPSADIARGTPKGHMAGSQGAVRSIVANGQHSVLDCGGGRLAVVGNTNVLSVSNCSRLDIVGNGNQLTARFAGDGAVAMQGNHNHLRWSAPAAAKVGISDPGTGNSIARQ